MGNVPDKPRNGIRTTTSQSAHENSFQAQRQVILPFRTENTLPMDLPDLQDHAQPSPPDQSDILISNDNYQAISSNSPGLNESLEPRGTADQRTDSGPTSVYSGYSSATSGARRRRYIKRYQSEEEKLLDMVNEKDRLLKTAVFRGQELRAKCNRYKNELDTLKQSQGSELTEDQWKRKYQELDKTYRDMKENVDVLEARIKNGRDMLVQSNETIDLLNEEIRRMRLGGVDKLSTSMPSLATVKVKDPKGRRTISQLLADNSALQEEVRQLTNRNRNGREYLKIVEQERRDHQSRIAQLERQVRNLQVENNNLRRGEQPFNHRISATGMNIYAQVNKRNQKRLSAEEEEYIIEEFLDDDFTQSPENPETPRENVENRSMGFALDIDSPRYSESDLPSPLGNSTNMYEEVEVSNGQLTASGASIHGGFKGKHRAEGRIATSGYNYHGNEYRDDVFISRNDDVTTRF